MEHFKFENEIINQAIWGNNSINNRCPVKTRGYTWDSEQPYGRGMLEYIMCRIFNIHRFPDFYPFYVGGVSNKIKALYDDLTEEKIENACEEYKRYYNFLQDQLKGSEYNQNGKVLISRSLKGYEYDEAVEQLSDESLNCIELPINIIQSYAYGKGNYYYGSSMYVERDIDIERIVLWEETLCEPDGTCINAGRPTEKEVWVLSCDIFGKEILSRDLFYYKELPKTKARFQIGEPRVKDEPIYGPENLWLYPCQYNKFTKWIIGKNMKKIEEEYGVKFNTRTM